MDRETLIKILDYSKSEKISEKELVKQDMNFKEFLTSKKYGSLHYKLSYFFHNRIPFFPLVGMNIIIPGIYGGNVESILRNLNGV